MSLRAIVFDFDGVIADSEPLHYRSFRDVLAPLGVALTEADYYARYLGFDDVGVFQRVSADAGHAFTAERVHALVAEKARLMEALERDVSVLYPGAADAVRRAAAAVPIAIASGALRREIERVLVRENLIRHFTAIVAAEDTPQSKPAPDPYIRAVEQLSSAIGQAVDPRECVAIEDSLWGLQSARAAGLRTVAVAHTYPATGLTGADLTIRSINDLDLRACTALFSE
jgi:HAD superfamily hydrolase (TIGR01509 family)